MHNLKLNLALVTLLLAFGLGVSACSKGGPTSSIENVGGDIKPVGPGPNGGQPEMIGTGEAFGGGVEFLASHQYPMELDEISPLVVGGASIDGQGTAYASTGRYPTLGEQDFTVGFQINTSGAQNDLRATSNVIVAKSTNLPGYSPTSYPFRCEMYNGTAGRLVGKVQCSQQGKNSSIAYYSVITPTRLDDGLPHHIFFTRRGGWLLLLVDGVKVAKLSLPADPQYTPANQEPVRLAGMETSSLFTGDIKYLGIYDRAFSDETLNHFYVKLRDSQR